MNEQWLRSMQRAVESMMNIKRKYRIRATLIRGITYDVVVIVKWNWAGHIARIKEDRWIKLITEWYVLTSKRKMGIQPIRCREEIVNYNIRINWKEIRRSGRNDRSHFTCIFCALYLAL